jgi:putative IMPACT (imprinted ancient) family translation regulator
VVAVVTRYFGGTLLGRGGLLRAYTAGVTKALATLPTRPRVPMSRVVVALEYSHADVVRHLLPSWEATVLHEEYTTSAEYHIEVPTEQLTDFERALRDLTAGNVLFEAIAHDA